MLVVVVVVAHHKMCVTLLYLQVPQQWSTRDDEDINQISAPDHQHQRIMRP